MATSLAPLPADVASTRRQRRRVRLVRGRTGAAVVLLLAVVTAGVAAGPGATPDPPTSGSTTAGTSVTAPSRPAGADAADRWWRTCTAGMPASAYAAERWSAACW